MPQFEEYIKDSSKILLISSQPLDLDCISSGLVMEQYLLSLGKQVEYYFPKAIDNGEKDLNKHLPFFDRFNATDTREALNKGDYDTLILVDGTNWVQFYDFKNETLPAPVLDKSKKIIQIDHHSGNPEDLTSLQIKNNKASSTIEIILSEIIPESFVDKNIATLAYAGLMGDTGNFRWNFNPNTLKLAAMLLAKGAKPDETLESMFFSKTKEYLEGLEYALKNIVYDDELRTIFLLMPLEKQIEDGIDEKKLTQAYSAFKSEIAKSVVGYDRGIYIIEQKEKGKLKVGSRGNNLGNKISLPNLFSKLGGNGGGHFHAAGMDYTGNFEEFVIKLKNQLRDDLIPEPIA